MDPRRSFHESMTQNEPFLHSVGRPTDPADPHGPSHESMDPHEPYQQSVARPMGHFTTLKAHGNSGGGPRTG